MKVKAPTRFQARLIGRALEAPKFSDQRRALWKAVFKQAAATARRHRLSFSKEELVGYWLDLQPEETSGNSIAIDDILTKFKTIAQESGAVVVPLDSLEEFGDTWEEAPEDATAARLSSALEWRDGVHPVTDQSHLPRWCDNTVDADAESHLEPAFNGFDGFQLCR